MADGKEDEVGRGSRSYYASLEEPLNPHPAFWSQHAARTTGKVAYARVLSGEDSDFVR